MGWGQQKRSRGGENASLSDQLVIYERKKKKGLDSWEPKKRDEGRKKGFLMVNQGKLRRNGR